MPVKKPVSSTMPSDFDADLVHLLDEILPRRTAGRR